MSTLAKTAVVTGGSRGIGKAIALALAAEGLQVYLTYVSKPEEAEAVAADIRASGGQAGSPFGDAWMPSSTASIASSRAFRPLFPCANPKLS